MLLQVLQLLRISPTPNRDDLASMYLVQNEKAVGRHAQWTRQRIPGRRGLQLQLRRREKMRRDEVEGPAVQGEPPRLGGPVEGVGNQRTRHVGSGTDADYRCRARCDRN